MPGGRFPEVQPPARLSRALVAQEQAVVDDSSENAAEERADPVDAVILPMLRV
jgi:hypothetical protein